MRRLFFVFVAVSVALLIDTPSPQAVAAPGDAVAWTDCVDVTSAGFVDKCGAPDGYQIKFTNKCTEAIDVRICIEKIHEKTGAKSWECSTQDNVKPQKRDHDGFWFCHSTGRSTKSAIKSGSGAKFAADPK